MAMIAMAPACHRKARQADGPPPFQPSAVVKLQCPAEAPSSGPIPVEVMLDADARTYWDNQGILDRALNVYLVRRDRPGVVAVAKVDPSAMMLPPDPLPGRPPDGDLARDRGRTVEHKRYDVLAYGRRHPGAASYFVIATFADTWAGPERLTVTDPAGPLEPEAAASLLPTAETPPSISVPASPGVTVRLARHQDKPAILGEFRTAADQTKDMVVTLVLGQLTSTGGALVRQFRLPSRSEPAGAFAIPLSALDKPNPAPPAGRYVLFAFVAGEAAPPTVIELR